MCFFICFDELGINPPVMPASSLFDMDRSVSGGLEDQRALHLAFELSRLNLTGDHHNMNSVSDSLDPVIIPTAFPEETRSKKSQNMTECVPVPSSEHVAEIVGRQGKSLIKPSAGCVVRTKCRWYSRVFQVSVVFCAPPDCYSVSEDCGGVTSK